MRRTWATLGFASQLHRKLMSHVVCDAAVTRQLILSNTVVSRDHLTPEIPLRLITLECEIFHEPVTSDRKIFEKDPFWGFYWPGGQALTRFILDTPDVIKNKRILDIGTGCGATSIAAAKCKADVALANDIDEAALIATRLNVELNGVDSSSRQLQTSAENLIGEKCPNFDVIFIGDMFYDSDFAADLITWLRLQRKNGKEIFVGDPGRHGVTNQLLGLMEKMATYELPENVCIENNGFKNVSVWRFK